ncbi:MAG: SPOR domain-containing protein [Candidatus Puniceispirillaceae bacterium]
MDTEDKQSHKSKLIWLVFLGIIIGLGAIGGFVIWPQLSLKTPADVIIVKAVDGPIKVKPLDPGGATVAHQDLLVIDMLKNGVVNTDEVETLRPVLSSPEPPPIDGGKPENATDQASSQTDNMAAADKVPAPAGEVGNASTPSVTTPKTDTEKPKPKPEKTIAQAPTKQGDGPAFVIQLAAFRSAEKAEEIANLLSEKHSSRLESIKLQTMRLDNGANGIFFRVVSPPLPRSVAETACAKLRRAGQDCFLRKFTAPDG